MIVFMVTLSADSLDVIFPLDYHIYITVLGPTLINLPCMGINIVKMFFC